METPKWVLLWSGGDDRWSCAGLHATRGEAERAFHEWDGRAGRLVLAVVDERDHRDIDAAGKQAP
jgi:hypothetical protein